MPYFLISVILKDKSSHKGLRESFYDLDAAYLAFQVLAQQAYGRHNIMHFECMQLSNHSEQVKLYLKKKGRTGTTTYKSLPDNSLGVDR